jgi:hypothetical protein
MTLALAQTAPRSDLQYGSLLTFVALLGVLAHGAVLTNDEIERVFCVVRGACALDAVPKERQFLLEAVLPNALGALLATLGLKGQALVGVWIVTGYAALTAVCARAVHRGAVGFATLALVAVLSRTPEVAFYWVGKPDSYLLAMLVGMAAEDRGWRRNAFALAATLCHPPIGVLSAAALAFFEADAPRRFDAGLAGSAVAGYFAAKLALHWEAPGLIAREAFAIANIKTIAMQVKPYALDFFAASFSPIAAAALAGFIPLPTSVERGRAARAGLALGGFWVFATVLTLDHTRVFALLCAPLLLAAARAFRVGTVNLWALALIALIVAAGPHLDQLGFTSCGNLIAPSLFR